MKVLEGGTREIAQQHGVKFYFTGKECKRGHLAARYVSTGQCVECSRMYNGQRFSGFKDQAVLVKVATPEIAFRVYLFAQALQKEHEAKGDEAVALHNKLMAQKLEMEQRQHMAEFNARLNTR